MPVTTQINVSGVHCKNNKNFKMFDSQCFSGVLTRQDDNSFSGLITDFQKNIIHIRVPEMNLLAVKFLGRKKQDNTYLKKNQNGCWEGRVMLDTEERFIIITIH